MSFEHQLASIFRKRLNSNRNVIVVFVGPTGEGKSLSAGRIGELTDKEKDPTLFFEAENFLELVDEMEPGRVLIWDEAGLGIPAREWQSLFNRISGYITQSFRFKNLGLFITVPNVRLIDVQERTLAHWYVHCKHANRGIHKVVASPYKVWVNPLSGQVRSLIPKFQNNGRVSRVREFLISLPSKEFREKYEEARKTYVKDYYSDLRSRVRRARA